MKYSTRTYTYVLPLLCIKKEFIERGLIGCFLRAEDYPEYDKHVILVFDRLDPRTDETISYLDRQLSLEIIFDRHSRNLTLAVEIPPARVEDYKAFCESKYSKPSKRAKSLIVKFHSLKREHIAHQILNKSEKRFRYWERRIGCRIPRAFEIGEKIEISDETYYGKLDLQKSSDIDKVCYDPTIF